MNKADRLFEKIGKLGKKEKEDLGMVPSIFSTVVGATAGIVGTELYAGSRRDSLSKYLGPRTTNMPEQVKKDIVGFKMKHGLKTKVYIGRAAHPQSRRGPYFNPYSHPIAREAVGPAGVHSSHPTKSSVMLHELGHAADFKKHRGFKTVLRAGGLGVGLLGASVLMSDKDTRKYAPAAAAAGWAPTLYQEGKASYLAHKYLKQTRGAKASRKSSKRLVKMFGTYAAAPAGMAAGV